MKSISLMRYGTPRSCAVFYTSSSIAYGDGGEGRGEGGRGERGERQRGREGEEDRWMR